MSDVQLRALEELFEQNWSLKHKKDATLQTLNKTAGPKDLRRGPALVDARADKALQTREEEGGGEGREHTQKTTEVSVMCYFQVQICVC